MMHGYYNWGRPGFGFFGFPIFGILIGLVLLVLVIYITVMVIRKLRYDNYHSGRFQRVEEDPLFIAKRRYAKGEISKEEYEEILKNLEYNTWFEWNEC